MPVEFHAREGAARVEEHLSLKLSMHMLVAGIVIGNAGYMGQQYSPEGGFKFKDAENVRVDHHEGSVAIKLTTKTGSIKYIYDLRMRQCHCITLYNVAGDELEANPDMVQESYEALVSYCCKVVIDQRIAYAQQVEATKATEE